MDMEHATDLKGLGGLLARDLDGTEELMYDA